jgi:hypothetical protein
LAFDGGDDEIALIEKSAHRELELTFNSHDSASFPGVRGGGINDFGFWILEWEDCWGF